MQTKLTLRMEQQVIEEAKQFAQEQGKSLSRLVADYFQSLQQRSQVEELLPITRSLCGLLEGSGLEEQDYKKHLEEKHR